MIANRAVYLALSAAAAFALSGCVTDTYHSDDEHYDKPIKVLFQNTDQKVDRAFEVIDQHCLAYLDKNGVGQKDRVDAHDYDEVCHRLAGKYTGDMRADDKKAQRFDAIFADRIAPTIDQLKFAKQKREGKVAADAVHVNPVFSFDSRLDSMFYQIGRTFEELGHNTTIDLERWDIDAKNSTWSKKFVEELKKNDL